MSPTSLVWDIPQTGPPVSTGPSLGAQVDGQLINDIAAPLELNISGPEGWGVFKRNETKGPRCEVWKVGVVWVWLVGGGLVSLLVHGYCNRNSWVSPKIINKWI